MVQILSHIHMYTIIEKEKRKELNATLTQQTRKLGWFGVKLKHKLLGCIIRSMRNKFHHIVWTKTYSFFFCLAITLHTIVLGVAAIDDGCGTTCSVASN